MAFVVEGDHCDVALEVVDLRHSQTVSTIDRIQGCNSRSVARPSCNGYDRSWGRALEGVPTALDLRKDSLTSTV